MFVTDEIKEQIAQWAKQKLSFLGYTLRNQLITEVRNTPWSFVLQFNTTGGQIYLKHAPEMFSKEPEIIEILRDKFHASVPTIIAQSEELQCFLMKDAGIPLRKVLKETFDENLVCKTVEQFTSLQVAAADNLPILFEVDVPDYRIEKLPGLFENLILKTNVLIDEGLSIEDVHYLEQAIFMVQDSCQKLLRHPIKQSIVQPDFNDNNTLIDKDTGCITIIDLGEIVISHPFFAHKNFLEQIKKHHELDDENEVLLKIQDACLKKYMDAFESENQCLEAYQESILLNHVYGLINQQRFIEACGKRDLISYQYYKFADLFKDFIKACKEKRLE